MINTYSSRHTGEAIDEAVDEVQQFIPTNTSIDNPLANQGFVNSSINNMAAFYITYTQGNAEEPAQAFPNYAALNNATTFYSGGKERIPTQNDYTIVLLDETQEKNVDGAYPTTRYSYQGGTYPNGQWEFQYIINNTSLTQAQVDALNSGITKELVGKIGEGNEIKAKGTIGSYTGQLSSVACENNKTLLKNYDTYNDTVLIDSVSKNITYSGLIDNGKIGAMNFSLGAWASAEGTGSVVIGPLATTDIYAKPEFNEDEDYYEYPRLGLKYNNSTGQVDTMAKSGPTTTNNYSIAIGANTCVEENNAIGMGYNTYIHDGANRAVAIGDSTVNCGADSITIGTNANTNENGTNSVVIGKKTMSTANNVINIGSHTENCNIPNSNAINIGMGTNTCGKDSVNIGNNAQTNSQNSVGIGLNALVAEGENGANSVAIGNTARANSADSVVLGTQSASNGAQGIAIGRQATINGEQGIAIGDGAQAKITSIAIGKGAKGNGSGGNGIAIGSEASTSGDWNTIAIGTKASAANFNSIAIGNEASVSGGNGVALGYQAKAGANGAVQLGTGTNEKANTLQFQGAQIYDAEHNFLMEDGVRVYSPNNLAPLRTKTIVKPTIKNWGATIYPLEWYTLKKNTSVIFSAKISAKGGNVYNGVYGQFYENALNSNGTYFLFRQDCPIYVLNNESTYWNADKTGWSFANFNPSNPSSYIASTSGTLTVEMRFDSSNVLFYDLHYTGDDGYSYYAYFKGYLANTTTQLVFCLTTDGCTVSNPEFIGGNVFSFETLDYVQNTYTFPNKSGTVAMLDDLHSISSSGTQQFELTTSSWTGSSAPYTATITHNCGLRPFISIWSASSPFEKYDAIIRSVNNTTISIISNVKVALYVQMMASGAT